MSPTTRTTDREISSSEVLLAWGDLDDDLLQRGDLDDDSLLISTDNRTTWTPRTPI